MRNLSLTSSSKVRNVHAALKQQLAVLDGVVDEDECTDDEEPSGVDYTAVLGEAPANGNDSVSLENALRQFTAVDQLAGPNAYECERCCAPANKKVRKTVKLRHPAGAFRRRRTRLR